MLICNALRTNGKEEFIDISREIGVAIRERGIKSGIAVIYIPHTTAAVTINENADPDVLSDMTKGLAAWGFERMDFSHFEGNSPAHLKSSILGASAQIIIEDSKPLLGTWQGIYFCEFDGPRSRKYYIKVIEG